MKLLLILLTFVFCMFPFAVLADAIIPPTNDEVQSLMASVGGLAGMKALGIAYFVIQALMLIIRTEAGALLGKYRLVIAYLISIVVGVMAMMVSGVGIGAALVHANTLAAFGVFFNQIFKQFVQKGNEVSSLER